jgi:hypothetical protein
MRRRMSVAVQTKLAAKSQSVTDWLQAHIDQWLAHICKVQLRNKAVCFRQAAEMRA